MSDETAGQDGGEETAEETVTVQVMSAPDWFTDRKGSTAASRIPAGVVDQAVATLQAGGKGTLYAALDHGRDVETIGAFADELREAVAAAMGLEPTWIKGLERKGPDGRWYSGVKYRETQIASKKRVQAVASEEAHEPQPDAPDAA